MPAGRRGMVCGAQGGRKPLMSQVDRKEGHVACRRASGGAAERARQGPNVYVYSMVYANKISQLYREGSGIHINKGGFRWTNCDASTSKNGSDSFVEDYRHSFIINQGDPMDRLVTVKDRGPRWANSAAAGKLQLDESRLLALVGRFVGTRRLALKVGVGPQTRGRWSQNQVRGSERGLL